MRIRGEGNEQADARHAVASLGLNPTFADLAHPVLEVHVIGWEGDLYGADVEVCFWGFLRAEAKFDSAAALVAQMHLDLRASQALLAQAATTQEF
ncbi:MAG: riboflavin kinase [Myxococcales bacterium]|nr:riboflavin kinase [Myxococcales bacterium]